MYTNSKTEKSQTSFPGAKSAGNPDADSVDTLRDDMPEAADVRKYPAHSTLLTLVVLGVVSLLTIAGALQLGVIENVDTTATSTAKPS